VIQLLRCPDLQELPQLEKHDTIGDGKGVFLIMRYEKCRDSNPPQHRAQVIAHCLTQSRIEIGKRLIEQQCARLDDHGASERDTLLLAA
jgi:hypothetical protein